MEKMVKASFMSDVNITPLVLDEDIIQLKFKSESSDEVYLVSKNEYDEWKCDCPDYMIHCGEEGCSYLCKHLLKAISYLFEHQEELQQMNHYHDEEVEGINGC